MILFYAAQNDCVVETLGKQLSRYKVARCRSMDTVERRLRKPRHGLEIALVVVDGDQVINRLYEIQCLFRDLRLVLVLPDREAHMVSRAHKLTPRFIGYADQRMEPIGAVIGKMMGASVQRSSGAPMTAPEYAFRD